MSLTLHQFVERVTGFRALKEPAKIKLFVWFLHRKNFQERVSTADIRGCYDTLHYAIPNISENLSRLSERKPRVLLKDATGFYLEGAVGAELDAAYLPMVQEVQIEIGDHVVPDSMIRGTKPYIEKLALQINGCYQCKFFDGCLVLMRRLTESLLIEVFAKVGHVEAIRQNNEFLMLNGILSVVRQRKYFTLARGSEDVLDNIKYAGDRAAHSRSYISTINDVKDHILEFRTITAELLGLAGIHPS